MNKMNVAEVFVELSSVWSSLSNDTKEFLAESIAIKYDKSSTVINRLIEAIAQNKGDINE